MLTATPKHILSKTFLVDRADQRLGEINLSMWRTRGEVMLGDQTLALRKRGVGRETFAIEQDGAVVAEAEKSLLRHRYTLRLGSAECEVRRKSVLGRAYEVTCGGRRVGSVEPVSLFSRAARIDLPDDWPLALQLFVAWLALVSWERQQAASGG